MDDAQLALCGRFRRDAVHDRAGLIGGAVVDGDDFELRII